MLQIKTIKLLIEMFSNLGQKLIKMVQNYRICHHLLLKRIAVSLKVPNP